MGRVFMLIAMIFCILPTWGCTTKVFTFKTANGAKVTAVSPSDMEEEGTLLGETPLTVDMALVSGKIVRVAQNGKQSMYWVFVNAIGDTNEAVFKLADEPAAASAAATAQTPGGKGDTKATANRVIRLLMRSYQALSGKQFKEARELADQAAAIDPELAGPQVMKGLSFFQEGDVGEAKAALKKAQALDPEDKDIDTLLQVVR